MPPNDKRFGGVGSIKNEGKQHATRSKTGQKPHNRFKLI